MKILSLLIVPILMLCNAASVSALSSGDVIANVNSWRANNGLSSLVVNAQLMSAATAKANDMCRRNYWSHNDPSGRSWIWFANRYGYSYTSLGENLAYGFTTVNGVVNAWDSSPEHHANLVGAYTETGSATITCASYQGKSDQIIVVQEYGTRKRQIRTVQVEAVSAPVAEIPKPIKPIVIVGPLECSVNDMVVKYPFLETALQPKSNYIIDLLQHKERIDE